MTSPVFISYRRSDSQHATGRLFARLAPRFLAESEIFMDIEAIAAGADFEAALDRALSGCKVCLVMIGPDWTRKDAEGRRRIDDPDDFVRREVAAVLARDILVIPVLIDGAPMPKAADLPDPLKPLVKRNALRLSHDRFEADGDAIAAKTLKGLGRSVDLEQDLLKLFFSFKGSIGRQQFWIGLVAVFVLAMAVAAGTAAALGIKVSDFLAHPETLPKNVQILQQIATTWVWWPLLALAWKRIQDLGHSWDVFAPILATSLGAVGLDAAGYADLAGTFEGVSLLLLLILGVLKGTRFIAHDA